MFANHFVAFLLLIVKPAMGRTGVANSTTQSVMECCKDLDNRFPDQTIYRNDSQYVAANERWTDNAQLLPTCIFLPKSASDVSAAIKIFVKDKYHRGVCPFAIKSGGHTPWAGANDIDGGVALVLSNLNDTSIADDRSFVRLGSGAVWRSVYRDMNGTGLAFPGGRCPGTGVGGLTLGGGYSWFTGKVGFVADNVVNFEVVLASGEVTNANATHKSDLFRALKGGNNNFGVVTHFDVAAFEHNQKVYGGLVLVPANTSSTVLANFFRFTNETSAANPDSGLTIEFVLNTATGAQQILLWLIDTNSTASHEALLPFLDIQPQLVNRVATYSIIDYPSSVPPVTRVLMADATFVNDPDILKGIHNITLNIYNTFKYIPDLVWDFQFEPLPRHITEASIARGGNILGLDETKVDLVVVFLMPLWVDPLYDDDVYQAAEIWLKSIQEYTNSLGKGHPLEFVNYAAPFQNPMASYGEKNQQFMKAVSRKYDPDGIFQKIVPGGYKLGV